MSESNKGRAPTGILLTGASGFVGGALLPALSKTGAVRCLVRDVSRLPEDFRGLAVEADLAEPESLSAALEGMDEVYYLVHSMEPGGEEGFSERDRAAAENYVAAAQAAQVRRTIYLGGIGDDDESEHIDSRREVERILGNAGPELVALRASMIVGAGSASFGSLVRIVSRLPVLALPDWRSRRTQPIAIADVVSCLIEARNVAPDAYEVAGPDTLSFEEMTEVITELLDDQHRVIPLPFSNSKLEGMAAALVTGEDRELMEPLMAGLHSDLLVKENRAVDVFGVKPTPFIEAARDAIAGMDDLDG